MTQPARHPPKGRGEPEAEAGVEVAAEEEAAAGEENWQTITMFVHQGTKVVEDNSNGRPENRESQSQKKLTCLTLQMMMKIVAVTKSS